jgi:tRNA(Ile)-lysidine synthase TilS/MesJ
MRLGLEEAARGLRYKAFSDIASELRENCDKRGERDMRVSIALAHHMEDNAETVLMQMMRGSGLDGLCGMEPVRCGAGGEFYLRPLLAECRESIEKYLEEKGQSFCEDSTNADLTYSRNRIRKNILPELAALNPKAISHINQTAARMREIRDYMEAQTAVGMEECLKTEGDTYLLSVKSLQEMPRALRIRLIHRAIGEAAGAMKDIAAAHIDAVEQLIWKQSGRQVDLPYGVTAKRIYGEIRIASGKRDLKGGGQKSHGKAEKKPGADDFEEIAVDPGSISEENPLTVKLCGASCRRSFKSSRSGRKISGALSCDFCRATCTFSLCSRRIISMSHTGKAHLTLFIMFFRARLLPILCWFIITTMSSSPAAPYIFLPKKKHAAVAIPVSTQRKTDRRLSFFSLY